MKKEEDEVEEAEEVVKIEETEGTEEVKEAEEVEIEEVEVEKVEELNVRSSHATYYEPWYSTLIQVCIPLMLAGLGTITAGIILGNVQHWWVFKNISELFVMVPALCGLKGNLDMCVASRLSTHSNLGQLQHWHLVRQIVIGNLALVQVQAISCSLLLSIFTVVVHSTMEQKLVVKNLITLTSAALLTASTSCLLLDSLLMLVILYSQRYSFNPDYMATPIVASVGDVVSISLLSFSAALLYNMNKTHIWISIAIICCYSLLLLPFCILVVTKNSFTSHVLKFGWVPVMGALCISMAGGLVLSSSVDQFETFAVFSPIISGIGGNLVSVQASSMGSLLYQHAKLGTLPPDTRICDTPMRTLCFGTMYARVSRILIITSIPSNIFLMYLADFCYQSKLTIMPLFLLSYVLASLVQLLILLQCAHSLVHLLWKWGLDPDSAAIPYLTAISDLLGTALLSVVFHSLHASPHEYRVKVVLK